MTASRDERFVTTISALAVATRAAGEVDEPTIELYIRALEDVPIDLLESAAVEMVRELTWFPRPAEWREYVDKVLDSRERFGSQKALASGQMALPGEVAVRGEIRCAECDGTGWVQSAKTGECSSTERCELAVKGVSHTHRCADAVCVARRRRKAEVKKRYGRRE
jgi:hypothetical protein